MNTIIKALLGASMLMPIAAQADARQLQAGVDGQVDQRGDGQRDRPARAAPQAANRDAGNVRQERRDDRQDFRRERQDDRQDFTRERRDDRAALRNGAVTPGQFQADRRDDRQDFRADRRDDRQDFRADRQDDRRDAGRGRQGQWTGNNGWNNHGGYGGSYGNQRGGNWTRDWRSDRRYDWNGYRGSNRNAYRLPRYYAPQGWGYGYRRFSIGVTLSSVLWGQDYWIDDPYAYRLPEAYGPYRWVRYYNDALLVDLRSGRVVDAVNDIFW